MKTAEEVFLSVLEKELDFVAEDKLKFTARALVNRLGMWNVKFLDTTHDTMTVLKPEKTIDEYRAEHAQVVQKKMQELIKKRPVSEDEQERFKVLVLLLAEQSYRGFREDTFSDVCGKIHDFEKTIRKSGYGAACFDIAWDDWDGINFNYTGGCPHSPAARFFADYDDGHQAPFNVCEWCDDFEKLEELLKQTSPTLYEMYQERLQEEREEKSFYENPCK